MIEPKEEIYTGVWFLPGDDKRIQGRLTVSDNFIDLHLTDVDHHRFVMDESLDLKEFPIIYGITQHNEFITLFDCSGYFGDISARLMLYGDSHFEAFEELKFQVMSVNLPYLDKWLNPGSFKRQITKKGFLLTYEQPEKIQVDLNSEFQLTIEFNCRVPDPRDKNRIVLNEYATLQLVSKNEDGSLLPVFLRNLHHLQQFASFMFRDGANIDVVRVYSKLSEFTNNRLMGTMLFTVFPFNKYAHTDFKLHPLVPFDSIKDNLQNIIQQWMSFAANGQHIIQLVLQDYFNRSAFDENRFLNLIRALEIYHAFRFPGTLLSPADFKRKLETIVAHIPEIYKAEVKAFLQYSNEPSLDDRLQALLRELNDIKIGYDYVYDADFIKNVKWSRNYYTHYNPRGLKKAAKGQELVKLTEACRTLINFLLLKHLQISDQQLAESFKFYFENSYYSNYFL